MSRIPRTGSVRVKLDGLMLGRYGNGHESSLPVYEVGFLRAPGHDLTICYEIVDQQNHAVNATRVAPPQEGHWRLEVFRRADADAQLFITDEENFDRVELSQKRAAGKIADDDEILMDFRWVLDLEGKEFPEHPEKLYLKPNRLHPIIQFPHGIVFNEAISDIKVVRSFNGGQPEPFGEVSDIIGIDIDAKVGEEIVLRNVETGDAAFRIPVEEGRRIFININNIPPDHGLAHLVSHFHFYYTVFDNVREKYDIEPEDAPPPDQRGHHDAGGHDHHAPGVSPGAHAGAVPAPPKEITVCAGGRGGGGAPLCGANHLSKHTDGIG
jgi:hypothetical protein